MSANPLRLPAGRLEEKLPDAKPLYSEGEAIAEATRCLYCVDAPCVTACPTGIDIPTFIRKIATGNVKGAARVILEANLLGYSCARVCPVEVLCAGACVYNPWQKPPIQIGRLQRYATETTLKEDPDLFHAKAPTGKRIALVGAGPASVAAAGWLALEGHECVIFERKSVPGGLNTLGIAPYKLLGDDSLNEIEWVRSLGKIEIKTGEAIDAKRLRDFTTEFDAVFLGLGLGGDSRMGIPGEDAPGVFGATQLIERIKSDPSLTLEGIKRALVVGGGNTAIDAAHELKLLGVREVALLYRRREKDMSAYAHELEHARKHGVQLIENRLPVEVLRKDGRAFGLRVSESKDGKPYGRLEELAADLIAVAIGQAKATQLAAELEGVKVDDKGRIVVDAATGRTGNPKVWSGGDCVNGGKEVVNAVQEAKLAARDIHKVITGSKLERAWGL